MSKAALKDVPVHEYLAFQLDASKKTRNEIAKEAGFERPNVLSMMRAGTMPVPIRSAGKLASALGVDPGAFVRRVLAQYQPDLLAAIEDHLGGILTTNEKKMLEIFRNATKGTDPEFNTKTQETAFARAVREVFMD